MSKVLVVDDNVDSARMLELLLEAMGYQARSATTGAEALEVSSEYLPDAILLDLTLPDTTGFELAGRLREIDGLASVKLVAVTGWSDPDLAKQATKLGFAAFLIKPLDPGALEKVLR